MSKNIILGVVIDDTPNDDSGNKVYRFIPLTLAIALILIVSLMLPNVVIELLKQALALANVVAFYIVIIHIIAISLAYGLGFYDRLKQWITNRE